MQSKTFRIGSTDYQVVELLGGSSVRFDEIPRYDEVRTMGKEYQSVGIGIEAIRKESTKGFKKYTYDTPTALSMAKDENIEWGLRRLIWEACHTDNGTAKSSGYVVFLSKGDPVEADWFRVMYCRGVKAAGEVSVDLLLPEVIDTTEYTSSQMFYLNNGMSEERWMST